MAFAATPPHILLSLATVATPGTTSDLHGSSVALGLSCSFCLSRFGRGMSVDVSGVSCAFGGDHGRQSMMEIRILGRQ